MNNNEKMAQEFLNAIRTRHDTAAAVRAEIGKLVREERDRVLDRTLDLIMEKGKNNDNK